MKFFATSEWKAQQSVTLMDYTDVGDISAQHGDMEISASLLWPWKEAPCALPWAAPSLSSAAPVNGCEREHLDRFDRPTLRRKWSSANLFLTKKKHKKTGKLPSRTLLGRDGSLLIMAISFCKWPQFFYSLTSRDWTYRSLYTNIPSLLCLSLNADKQRAWMPTLLHRISPMREEYLKKISSS